MCSANHAHLSPPLSQPNLECQRGLPAQWHFGGEAERSLEATASGYVVSERETTTLPSHSTNAHCLFTRSIIIGDKMFLGCIRLHSVQREDHNCGINKREPLENFAQGIDLHSDTHQAMHDEGPGNLPDLHQATIYGLRDDIRLAPSDRNPNLAFQEAIEKSHLLISLPSPSLSLICSSWALVLSTGISAPIGWMPKRF